MKKWKKWLSVGMAAVTLGIISGSVSTVNANPFEPYDRSGTVVREEQKERADAKK